MTKPAIAANGAKPKPLDHIVFTDFDGEEGILVDLNTKKYYQLNETAMLIWKSLEEEMATDEIAARLVASYEVTHEDALKNVEQLLNELASYKLVEGK
ncbi:MAG TPA: PqqD family protein [Pyrinomonadaceae bacterium]